MWNSNSALIPDADHNDSLASQPHHWPLMLKGIRMCGWDDTTVKFYMLGNPLVWWLSTACLFAIVACSAFYLLRFKRGFREWYKGKGVPLPLTDRRVAYIPILRQVYSGGLQPPVLAIFHHGSRHVRAPLFPSAVLLDIRPRVHPRPPDKAIGRASPVDPLRHNHGVGSADVRLLLAHHVWDGFSCLAAPFPQLDSHLANIPALNLLQRYTSAYQC